MLAATPACCPPACAFVTSGLLAAAALLPLVWLELMMSLESLMSQALVGLTGFPSVTQDWLLPVLTGSFDFAADSQLLRCWSLLQPAD